MLPDCHVVITTPPTQGHVRPSLRLAQILADRALQVSVLLPLLEGAETPTTSDAVHIIPIIIPANEVGQNVGKAWRWIEQNRAQIQVRCCAELASTCPAPPTVLILDQFSVWSIDLAKHFSIPAIVFLASPLVYLHLALKAEDVCLIGDTAPHTHPVSLPGLGEVVLADLPEVHTTRSSWHHAWIVSCFSHYREVNGFVANDIEAVYPGLVQHLRDALTPQVPLWPIGPLTGPLSSKALSGDVAAFLDRHKTDVMYIAFGSWCVMPQDHLKAFTDGLVLSDKPFIWAYRPLELEHWLEILPKSEIKKVLSSRPEQFESDGLPKGFRERVGSRALIVPWVDQPSLLAHPAVRVFATHCGWNSLSEAISCDREDPLTYVCVPLGAEQSLNAAVIEKIWKCGERVYNGGGTGPVEAPSPERVAAAIERVFTDDGMRQAAKALSTRVLNSSELVQKRRDEFVQWIRDHRTPLDVAEGVHCP